MIPISTPFQSGFSSSGMVVFYCLQANFVHLFPGFNEL